MRTAVVFPAPGAEVSGTVGGQVHVGPTPGAERPTATLRLVTRTRAPGLYLNYEQRSDTDAQGGNDTIVRRAVFLDSVNAAIPDIVFGEAKTSVRGC